MLHEFINRFANRTGYVGTTVNEDPVLRRYRLVKVQIPAPSNDPSLPPYLHWLKKFDTVRTTVVFLQNDRDLHIHDS